MKNKTTTKKQILIVGGGAGGLELAAALSKNSLVDVILVDCELKHVWKPLLHEVAAGTLLTHEDELDFIPYSHEHNFKFVYGRMLSLDRANKQLTVSAMQDKNGKDFLPLRTLHYDYLVLAIGSLSNDFNIPGVKENCLFIDNLKQAEFVQEIVIGNIIQLAQLPQKKSFDIAIVGGGATGVELAAELHYAVKQTKVYQTIPISGPTRIMLIEARDRLVPQLPEKISKSIQEYLQKLHIEIYTNEQVAEINKNEIITSSGKTINADLKIWAAGIKADAVLKDFAGLETNHINQLVVNEFLQTTRDNDIFAMGDCAASTFSIKDAKKIAVPPTAQAAHQQAAVLAKSIPRLIEGKSLLPFKFVYYGSVVAISRYNTVANLMGKFTSTVYLKGKVARLVYTILHKSHQMALHGFWRVFMTTFANKITRRGRPRLKLH